MQATGKDMLTQMETVRAHSKEELYRKLFEEYGKYYYHIVDEKVKRKFPLFWKKEYELKLMVLRQEEQPTEPQVAPTAQAEPQVAQPPKDEGVERILAKLENDTDELQRKPRPESFDPASAAARKKELLQVLKEGFSMYDKEEEKIEQKIEKNKSMLKSLEKSMESTAAQVSSKDIEELKAAIAKINEKLGDGQDEQEEHSLPEALERLTQLLRDNDVEERLINIYIQSLQQELTNVQLLTEQEIRARLLEEMAAQFKTALPLDAAENKVIVLFGPTGVGKTTTISKLGWQFFKKQRSVGFITTDVFRSGAIQQLQGYADLMQSELRVAASKEELEEAVHYFRHIKGVDHILVDTAGRNYMDEDSVEEIQEYINILNPNISCLTFSASMRKRDVLSVLARFEHVQANYLVVTKLDETESIGDWLSVSSASDVPILFVTNGQNITRHIHVPTREWLAERVLSKDALLEGEIFDLRNEE